jgi:hypothetical protein
MKKLFAVGASLVCATGLAVLPLKAAYAGALGGPKIARESVGSRSVDRYTITFRAGERGRVWAVGDGDIDIEVYDENGNLIARDNDDDAEPEVAFTPRWTGPFTIRVINNERYRVDYVLRTN